MKRSILLFGLYLLAIGGYIINRDVLPVDNKFYRVEKISKYDDGALQNLTENTKEEMEKAKEDFYNISENN
ncbi:hypothetical protein H4O18_11215 [Arenibacter sp. BSSL-BM3]|uniref:Uncharacterized protein n=1 Tax=Arenibacter arenosicollis TaxID=2762274 RepID=A0ABR7QMZ5_9FLAO|nr:hypothetical protein [Arenibacter arenosicollis]MBC8768563.1 hypothetical protein [Arenibacter arenosicollis]